MKNLSKKKRGLIFAGALILMTLLSWYGSSAMPNPAEQDAKFDTPPQLIGGFAALSQNLVYPEKAKKAGVQGKVVLNVTIDETGKVREVTALPAVGVDKSLVEAAIDAVKATKWQPALLKGKSVAAAVTIPVEFKLDSGQKAAAADRAAALADQAAASADLASAAADQAAASLDQAAASADLAIAAADQAAASLDQAVASADLANAAAADYDQPPSPVGGFASLASGIVYPESAQKAGVEGKVLVNALIDEKGDVVETKILQSMSAAGCDEAAISAIRAVKWNPARKGEKAVKAWVKIPITFKLKE